MQPNVAIHPSRFLDPAKEQAIEYFYNPSGGPAFFVIIVLPITLGLSLGAAFWGLYQGLITGVIITTLLLARRRYVIRKTIRLAKHVYEYGTPATMTFVSRESNYSFKVNGAPQQVITIDINGHQTQIKTFARRVIDVYTIPQQTVYIHSEYPKIMVPTGIFELTPQPQRRGLRLGPALLILLPLGFTFGLVYFINSVMSAHSYTHAQPDALLYRQDGKLLFASVFSHFQAHEVSNGTTYGSDSYYAAAIDLQTGKRMWEVDLKANNSEGQDFGAGQLLGQSERYLFFLRNELYIIDKTNGHVVARNNDLPAIRDKLSKASVADYMADVVYKYSDSLQALVIKGNDGLFYTIDGNTLKTGAIDIADPDNYFRNKFKYGNNYEDQIASLSDDGNRCWALLDTKDTAGLTHDGQGFETRPAAESIRRFLFTTPANTNDSNWRRINPDVYLFGGFLVDTHTPLQTPEDTLSQYKLYDVLLDRYNARNAALRTRDEGYVLMHRSTIEHDAPILLTGLTPQGQARWQYAPGFRSIPFMYHDTAANTLYIASNNAGENGDYLMQLAAIDLGTGAVRQIPLK